jgi:oxygen-independent coproporphyrinogen-3 oxidase
MAPYVEACIAEISAFRADGGGPPATSVFFGGGTPSLLPPADLARILAAVGAPAGAEVTVECNPESVTAEGLATYLEAGVTRISLGVQSLRPAVLASLGRSHDPHQALRAIELVGRAGFETFSVDLIFGAVAERDGDWRRTLLQVLSCDPPPPHVSAYGLTVEPGTPLARDAARHPDDDAEARRYEIADEILAGAGLGWYEISNWALPGHECRHNRLYWSQGDYRGFGCAAHSHEAGRRWWNLRTPERYIRAISSAGSPVASEEQLSQVDRALEALQLSLRTRDGVPAGAIADEDVLASGLVELVPCAGGDRFVLTLAGRLLANRVSLSLRPAA